MVLDLLHTINKSTSYSGIKCFRDNIELKSNNLAITIENMLSNPSHKVVIGVFDDVIVVREITPIDNVTSINKNSTDSTNWTVIEALEDTADRIRSGEYIYNKCCISLLLDEDDLYCTGHVKAKMTGVEALSLLKIVGDEISEYVRGGD